MKGGRNNPSNPCAKPAGRSRARGSGARRARPGPAPAAPALPAPLGPWGPAGAPPPSGSAAFPWSRPCRRRPVHRGGPARRPRRCRRRRRPPPAPCRRRCGRPRCAAAPGPSCAGSARSWLPPRRRAGPRRARDLQGLPPPPPAAPDPGFRVKSGRWRDVRRQPGRGQAWETGRGVAGGPGAGGQRERLLPSCGRSPGYETAAAAAAAPSQYGGAGWRHRRCGTAGAGRARGAPEAAGGAGGLRPPRPAPSPRSARALALALVALPRLAQGRFPWRVLPLSASSFAPQETRARATNRRSSGLARVDSGQPRAVRFAPQTPPSSKLASAGRRDPAWSSGPPRDTGRTLLAAAGARRWRALWPFRRSSCV